MPVNPATSLGRRALAPREEVRKNYRLSRNRHCFFGVMKDMATTHPRPERRRRLASVSLTTRDPGLDGIRKRLERVLDPERLRREIREFLQPGEDVPDPVHDLAARLAETRTRIARLVQALAGGTDELPSVRAALVDLERQAQRLERELQAARARAGDAAPAGVDAIAEALVHELSPVADVLREGEPEERKRVVRRFLQGIRIEKATRQAVLRWYRLPRASFVKLVELRGVEPLTPRLPALCSPN
jgi:hypothetical protein